MTLYGGVNRAPLIMVDPPAKPAKQNTTLDIQNSLGSPVPPRNSERGRASVVLIS